MKIEGFVHWGGPEALKQALDAGGLTPIDEVPFEVSPEDLSNLLETSDVMLFRRGDSDNYMFLDRRGRRFKFR